MFHIQLHAVGMRLDQHDKSLFSGVNLQLKKGWLAIVGANGCGKSTLLRIILGELAPTSGQVQKKGIVVMNSLGQDTLVEPIHFSNFKDSYANEDLHLKTDLGLHELCHRPWSELSYGEKKRFQIACTLSGRPDLLIVDEPTNHLDHESREAVTAVLNRFPGIGLVVSHDRKMLNSLCKECLIHDGRTFIHYSGNYDQALTQHRDKQQAKKQTHMNIRNQIKTEQRKIQALRERQEKSQKKMSKKSLPLKDRDAREKINLAKLTGKDASFSTKVLARNKKLESLAESSRGFSVQKDYKSDVFFEIQSRTQRIVLESQEAFIPLPTGQKLKCIDFTIYNTDKIALIGKNGSGKSSFIKYICSQTQVDMSRCFYLPQEINRLDKVTNMLAELDHKKRAECFQIMARLGTDTLKFIQSQAPSPGDLRKLALALAILDQKDFLILDEPTNHLDLPSIEILEKALSDTPIGFLLVSHDQRLVERVAQRIFRIEGEELFVS